MNKSESKDMKNKCFKYGKYTLELQPNTANDKNWIIILYRDENPLLLFYNENDVYILIKGKYKGYCKSLFDLTLNLKKLKIPDKIINKLFKLIMRCKSIKDF